MQPRVAVAGGSRLARLGLAELLGSEGSEVSTLTAVADWQPGRDGTLVVMLASSEADPSKIEEFVEDHPAIPLIAVVDTDEVEHQLAMLRAGARAVVVENEDPTEILAAIGATLAGLAVTSPKLLGTLVQRSPDWRQVDDLISDEEADWLREMAQGQTVGEIAEASGHSERALFRILRGLYQRLGVANRTEALIWASQHGLLDD